jgi:membrane associated rhomboid family serine protease
MLFLVFGNNVEDRLGWALYCSSTCRRDFATIGQVLLDPSSTVPVIGASGAMRG